MATVFLSVGHNKAQGDLGATARGLTEYGIASEIADQAAFLSRRISEHAQFKVIQVPVLLGISDRCKWINARAISGDYMVELHMNAGVVTATGVETFYLAGSLAGKECARRLQMEYTKQTGLRGRGVKEDTATRFGQLGIIRGTKTLSLLLELGFITNPTDTQTVIDKGGRALFEGLKKLAG